MDGDDSQATQSNESATKKSRGLPDWMKDPSEIIAQQDTHSSALRANKEAFRNAATSEWENKPESVWKEVHAPPHKGRVICFDLETTGFGSEDSIIEIGAVEMIDGYRTGVLFQSYAKPRGPIHPMAQAAHQITEAMLHTAPPIELCVASFLDWELVRQSLDVKLSGHEVFCSLKYWRKLYPERAGTLNDMSAAFGVQRVVRRNVHGALVDAEILSNCFLHLLRLPNS